MADIDFDELDKAVAGLMKPAKDAAPKVNDAPAAKNQPVEAHSVHQSAIGASVATKRSGKFMDVAGAEHTLTRTERPKRVHTPITLSPHRTVVRDVVSGAAVAGSVTKAPVADANSQETTTAAEVSSAAPSQGASPAAEVQPDSTPSVDAAEVPVRSASPTPKAGQSKSTSTIGPDHQLCPPHIDGQLDAHVQPEVAASPEASPPDHVATMPDVAELPGEHTIAQPLPEAKSEPAASPFLPDAKVEKRPLGSTAGTATVQHSTPSAQPKEAQLDAIEQAAKRNATPVEYDPQVMALDSHVVNDTVKSSTAEAAKKPEASATVAAADVPQSIPHQYSTTQSKPVDTTAFQPIYEQDTTKLSEATPSNKTQGILKTTFILLASAILGAICAVVGFYIINSF